MCFIWKIWTNKCRPVVCCWEHFQVVSLDAIDAVFLPTLQVTVDSIIKLRGNLKPELFVPSWLMPVQNTYFYSDHFTSNKAMEQWRYLAFFFTERTHKYVNLCVCAWVHTQERTHTHTKTSNHCQKINWGVLKILRV